MARTIHPDSRLFEDIIDVLNLGMNPREGDAWPVPTKHRDVDAFSENVMVTIYLPRIERDIAIVVSRNLADGVVNVNIDFRRPGDGESDERLPLVTLTKPTAKLVSDTAAMLIGESEHLI